MTHGCSMKGRFGAIVVAIFCHLRVKHRIGSLRRSDSDGRTVQAYYLKVNPVEHVLRLFLLPLIGMMTSIRMSKTDQMILRRI